MALPIKSNNTQQGCNPISSNCVVWQGPDIPCINLCTGDSVSDVVAKMATELCEISDQLDISLLDLSCFNPLCPTPQNFRDVMQIIIDKICALENPNAADGGISTSGCPSDCEIAVAPCLQYTDNLGNTVTSLAIKDYVILIGNRICTILTSIANLQTQINALDTRVTNLENGSGGGGGGSTSFNVTSDCLATSPVTLAEYINLLDDAFCILQSNTGTVGQFTSASSAAACVTGSSPQIANPSASMSNDGNWLPSATSSFQQIQNLWVTVCDLRAGVTALQAQLNECCAPDVPCPNNLPRPTFELNKDSIANELWFRVTSPQSPGGNALINGEEWRLERFEGIVIPSSTGVPQSITVTIPNPSYASVVNYTGGTNSNKLVEVTGISNSLQVIVSGLFYWKNVATEQECSIAPTNNGEAIRNQLLAACPTLPPTANSNIIYSPSGVNLSCNAVSGSAVTLSLNSNYTPAGLQAPSGSVSLTVTYTNTGNQVQTFSPTLTSINNSVNITNIDCGSNVTVVVTGVSQAGINVPCSNQFLIPIPLPPN
jgi:hypothetical protein